MHVITRARNAENLSCALLQLSTEFTCRETTKVAAQEDVQNVANSEQM